MMEVIVISAWNLRWTCNSLLLINSLKKAPWYQNMLDLAP